MNAQVVITLLPCGRVEVVELVNGRKVANHMVYGRDSAGDMEVARKLPATLAELREELRLGQPVSAERSQQIKAQFASWWSGKTE